MGAGMKAANYPKGNCTKRFKAPGIFRGSLGHFSRPACFIAMFLWLAVVPLNPAQGGEDEQATFFMGRVRYSANDGNDCGGVGQDLMRLVSRASTLKVQEERKVSLNDPELFDTPFLFMNGHNDFVLTETELANLRKFLGHGGFFFASGC